MDENVNNENVNNENVNDTIVQTYIAAGNANALSDAIGIANNEISNLTHALLCLDDQTFEKYVLSIRTLREVSKSFDIAQKNFIPGYIPSENKIDFNNIQNAQVKQRKVTNSLEGALPKKEITFKGFVMQNLSFLGEGKSLKDFCNFVIENYWELDSSKVNAASNSYISMRINSILVKCKKVQRISRGYYKYIDG